MKATTALLIAALILVVVLVIYAVAKGGARETEDVDTKDPWDTYERTDGTFDEAARQALHQATTRPDPEPGDHLLAATILARNVIGQEHRPQTDGAGHPTEAAQERTQQRRAAYDQARTHYMQALEGLGRPRPAPAAAAGAAAMARAERGRPAPVEAERVIDEALGFAFGGFEALIANDQLLALLLEAPEQPGGLVPGNLTFFEGFGGLFGVDMPLAEAAFRRQEDVVRERQEVASTVAQQHGGGAGVAAATYLNLAQCNTSDSQNVHDPGVIACYKATIQRLREDQGALDRLPGLDAIIGDVRRHGLMYSEGRPERVKMAALAIEEARKGEQVTVMDLKDEECVRRVWARADDPRNKANKGKLRQALFDALVNSWEGPEGARKIVCVYGRISQQLGSLVLLDWDKRNWVVKKLEQFKNDVYIRAEKTIRAVAQAASESDDPDMQSAGRQFLTTSFKEQKAIEVKPKAAKKLRDDMRLEVSLMIDRYLQELEAEGVKGGIPDHMIDKVKEEALAAIMD
jgi:hypothetical protein